MDKLGDSTTIRYIMDLKVKRREDLTPSVLSFISCSLNIITIDRS